MEKKLLHIKKGIINKKILEINRVCEDTNYLYQLLMNFGIVNAHKAVENPIKAVKIYVGNKINNIDVPFKNALNLINKVSEFNTIEILNTRIKGYKYSYLIKYIDSSFRVVPTAEKEIRDLLTPFVTEPKQIAFVERVEDLITEAKNVGDLLGVNILRTDLLRAFGATIENDKVVVLPSDFLNSMK
jgi:hypothetical protein